MRNKRKCFWLFLLLALLIMAAPTQAATKAKWVKKDGAKYYLKEDGTYAVKSYKIKNTYYIFRMDGRLVTRKKDGIVTIGNTDYAVTKNGKAKTGWMIISKKLYYANGKGKIIKNKVYKGITLTKKTGAAKNNTATNLKKKTMTIVASITNSSMSKSRKLLACWNYMVSRSRFRYAGKYPNLNASGWQKSTAYNMLTTHSGNCYSFACAFASLANEVGYDSYVVCGRVPGSRDGAGDGYTRHAWVRIGGRYYDPEAQFAGWCSGIYGYSGYPMSHSIQRTVRFAG